MNGASSRWKTPKTRRSSGIGSAWSSTRRSQYGYSSAWTMWMPADWRPRRAPPGTRPGPRPRTGGRLRVVLHQLLHVQGGLAVREQACQVERHVDAGGDAGGGDDVAVLDEALFHHLHVAELAQLPDRAPVGGRPAAGGEAGAGEDEGARADGGDVPRGRPGA